jgi:oxygen-dependent protoporphyrinogen oxidase
VILAIPAPEAKQLFLFGDKAANRLLTNPYSATIHIALITASGFRLPDALKDVYGLLVPRRERQHIAAICIEANKNKESAQGGQLLSLLLSHDSAMALMALPDDEIAAAAVDDAERFVSGLSTQIAATRLYRWKHAEPCSQAGRARDIAEYRENGNAPDRRVWLAGDYMSMPFTEGAAESGKWAADAIGERLIRGTGK